MERIIEDVRALAFRDERLDGCDGRRPGYIDDLEWRWQCADDDMEPPSNMAAMVAAIQRGGPAHTNNVTNDIDDRAIQAAEKAHAIDEALGRISEAQKEVLWALYGTPDGSAEAILKHLPKAAEIHAECVKRKATHASLVSWFIGVSNTDRIWGSAVAGQIYEKVLSEAVAQAEGCQTGGEVMSEKRLAQLLIEVGAAHVAFDAARDAACFAISERLDEAVTILRECVSALSSVGGYDTAALDDAVETIHTLSWELSGKESEDS